jgi:hypothetical protein
MIEKIWFLKIFMYYTFIWLSESDGGPVFVTGLGSISPFSGLGYEHISKSGEES